MENFKNIELNDLKDFSGKICLYSLNFEKSLGENVCMSYSKLFQNNIITYNNSLASESNEDLIIIDGDDFNPSKIFGLTKKYEQPIVIFIINEEKKNKLKNLLLRNVLIINKNTLNSIDISEDVKKNVQEKKLKDIEKGLIEDKGISITPVEIDLDKNIPSGSEITFENGEKSVFISPKDKSSEVKNFDNEIIAELKFKEDMLKNKKEVNSFRKEQSEVETISKEDKILMTFNKRFTNNNLKINNFGTFGLSIEILNRFRDIFPNIVSIRTNGTEVYDVYILDISFATERVYDLIENIMPKPLIIMSSFDEKLKEIRYLNLSNILIIPKPLSYSQEELENKIFDYLNNYNITEESAKIKEFNSFFIPKGLQDDIEKRRIRDKYNSKTTIYKNVEENIQDTKEEINKVNKRADKDISLDDIYEKLGLNKLAVFESLINKEVYSTYDGKVVKYKPDGYLIEIRLERFKNKGLNEKEISSAMQRMEEADIRFERKQLMRIEKYKLSQLKKQNN